MRPDRCPVAVLLGRRCGATAPRQSRSARARVFATGQGRKTDATDAHSVALVGTRMSGLRPVVDDAQLAVLRVLVDRRRSLGDDHTRMVAQLHHLLLQLIPGGAKKDLSAAQAKALLATVRPRDAAGKARRRVAAELIADLERVYQRKKAANKELEALLAETGTSLVTLNGIGPSGAARLLVEVGDITRFPSRAHFASWNGTAPIDAGGVGDDERVPGVGLSFARIQLGDPPHRQPGQIADLDTHAASHRDRQRADRRRLVDHHQHPTMPSQFGEQLPQRCLLVRQGSVGQPAAGPVDRHRVVGLAGDVDAAEHLDAAAMTKRRVVGSRQLVSSSQPSRPATDDAPAATLRAGLRTAARSLSAVTNALRSR
jgi:hypothetical protein